MEYINKITLQGKASNVRHYKNKKYPYIFWIHTKPEGYGDTYHHIFAKSKKEIHDNDLVRVEGVILNSRVYASKVRLIKA